MTPKIKKLERNIILFVGTVPSYVLENIKEYEKVNKKKFRIAIIFNKKDRVLKKKESYFKEKYDIVLSCDFDSNYDVTQTLLPYKKEIVTITSRQESAMPFFKKIIPHVPYLRTPTETSIDWSTQKALMRRRFQAYDKRITPLSMVAKDATKITRKKIEEKLGFPVIVKPTGLAQSILVTVCYHQEELEVSLKKIFRKIHTAYNKSQGRGKPEIVVEQFIEGELYSIDAYVTSRCNISFCPPVAIKTGKAMGFDDFFGYQQMTPSLLNKESIEETKDIVKKAIYALGLRSTTAHVEILKTEKGWKVIEVGPRIGGFRDQMYKKSFGINHTMNDILTRIPGKINIPKKVLGHSASLKFFAKQEGILTKLGGIKKAQELKSFFKININKKIGDRCYFAKNGGKSVFNIMLFNKSRSNLLADIRRLEQMIEIETTTTTKEKNSKIASKKTKSKNLSTKTKKKV